MLYRNMKTMIRSSDGDTGFFDIVTGGLKWDTEESYLLIIFYDYER